MEGYKKILEREEEVLKVCDEAIEAQKDAELKTMQRVGRRRMLGMGMSESLGLRARFLHRMRYPRPATSRLADITSEVSAGSAELGNHP